jgi:hypothetical protein
LVEIPAGQSRSAISPAEKGSAKPTSGQQQSKAVSRHGTCIGRSSDRAPFHPEKAKDRGSAPGDPETAMLAQARRVGNHFKPRPITGRE